MLDDRNPRDILKKLRAASTIGGNPNPIEDDEFSAMSPYKSLPWDVNASTAFDDYNKANSLLSPMASDQEFPWLGLLNANKDEAPTIESTTPPMETPKAPKQARAMAGQPEPAVKTEEPKTTTPAAATATVEEIDPLAQMQADESDALRALAIIKGAQKVGQGLAQSYDTTSDYSGLEALAKKPLQDLLLRRKAAEEKQESEYKKKTRETIMASEAQANDPKSEYSKNHRQLAQAMLDMAGLQSLSKTLEGMSASEIDKKFPMFSNLATAKQAQDTKRELAAATRAGALSSAGEKKEAKKFEQETKLSSTVAKLDEKLKYSQGVYNLESFKEAVKSNPSGTLDVGLIYDYIKALDPNSAVREGEVDLITKASPFLQNVTNLPAKVTKGSMLPPQVRQQILKNIEMFNAAKKKQFLSNLKPIKNQIDKYGLEADNILLDTPGISTEDLYKRPEEIVQEAKAASSGEPKKVVKKQYSRSEDKTKITYSDGTEEILDGRK